MMDHVLKNHLEPIARNRRRWQLVRALTGCWLTAAAVGVILILIRILTGWSSPWTFLLLLAGTMVFTCVSCWRYRWTNFDYKALARKIEAENPELHAVLLTAIEQTPDPSTGELNYLQERVLKEALAHEESQHWNSLTLRRLDRMQISNGLALLLFLVVMVGLYFSLPRGGIFHGFMANAVTVTPGDTSVEKGSSLVVLARFDGLLPSESVLVVRPANEPERRIALTKNLDDPVFGTSLPNIKSELTYRVEYDNEVTDDYRVTVFEFPRLERADAKVTFPEYTGLPEKTIEDTRRVSAVEGSALDYTFHLNKPVKSATLVPKNLNLGSNSRVKEPTPDPFQEGNDTSARSTKLPSLEGSGVGVSEIHLVADTNRPNAYTTNFKLEKSGRYELILVDDAGRTNKLPPQFVLDVLTNRAPELKFAFPRGDQRVSALEEIAFQGETSDDFGLKAYGFAYNLAGQETKFVELGQAAGPHEKRAFDYQVALENLGAQPDQLLSYYLWADDIGPDGNARRTASDMFFAEVRPFEEIFREGQGQDPNAQQPPGQQGQNAAERLAELQKQIITATWNLQRREAGKTPTTKFKSDAVTVKESQENALEQVRSRIQQQDNPTSKAMLDAVEKDMAKAVEHLDNAAEDNSPKALPPALAAEQSAYQSLLRLAQREYQITQGQRGQGGQAGRGGLAQRQIDQLELRQSQNRYETERQAAAPQDPQQREQLQAFNRLKELAQRQQDVNERLKEIQAALQEARTEAEREELRARLKRLQEEQQQALADLDELRQRMERPENQTQMAEARQQLEQTRDEVQRAAEAMNRGEVSQALSSGTRAQRDLQQLRDDFRKQSSSQFAEDMRELRSQARELAQQQEDIGQKLDALNETAQRKTLTDSDERKEVASQLDDQKKRLDELVQHATEVTQKAEPVEPLLARQLYDTLRKVPQNDARNLQETTDDLLAQGKLYRSVYDRLREAKTEAQSPVAVAAELLRQGFSAEANNLEQRARRSIDDLKAGVERAAESVLGDDTEALRLARNELDELNRQLERELAQAQRQSNTNDVGGYGQQTRNQSQQGQQGNESLQDGQTPGRNQPGQQAQSGQRGQGQGGQQEMASGGQSAERRSPDRLDDSADAETGRSGDRRSGGQRGGSFLDQLGGDEGGSFAGGPITGAEYTQWSDRLRDVEEMLDVPELRAEAARIRDRARNVRQDLKRHAIEPQWNLVKMEIAGPLVELRNRIGEELARRESKEAIVPIDRDPVPTRYSELVRRYYEELGRSESARAADAGGVK